MVWRGASPILIDGIQGVIAARIVLGVCEALIITLSATLIGDYFSGTLRARLLAMISTTASLSAVAFFAVGGAIGAAYGWRWVTAMYGLSILFVPAMLLLTWEPQRQRAPEFALAVATPAQRDAFPRKHMIITGLSALFGGVLFYSLAIQ
jgi:MFS family permease